MKQDSGLLSNSVDRSCGVRKVENRQGSPDIKRDPAVVSILMFRGGRDFMGHLAQ